MRRLVALLGKELRQHALIGAGLLLSLVAAYLLMLLGALMGAETVSLFEVHGGFVMLFVVLAALVLGNRLVVAEYHGRSQLFLEALPIRRWEMVALKLGLGLALLLAVTGGSLAVTALAASFRESPDPRFLAIIAARSGAFVFCVWAFFFAMGLAGRFRVPIYLGIFLILTILANATALELQRFGPFAVIDPNTLPFERESMPTAALLETLGLGAGFVAVAFALALIHEGSVAEALSRRMSQKEKALVGILFTGVLFAAMVLDERRAKEPFAFDEDMVVAGATAEIEISYITPTLRADAEALSARLEPELVALRQTLGWARLPAVRVAFWPALDAGLYERAKLAENEGVLVRANFVTAPNWDPRDFTAFVVGALLDDHSHGRARFEPKAWLRDGFATWWSRRHEADDLETACADRGAPLPRALWVTRGDGLDESRLAAWWRFRERHGEASAEAVAWTGLRLLEERRGREAVLRLGRQVFGRVPPKDFRELFYEWRWPMPRVFAEATGLEWSAFIAAWRDDLARLGAAEPCRRALDALPRVAAEIEIERGAGTVRDAVFRVRAAEPPPAGTVVSLLHTRLTPFDDELERGDLGRVEHLWPAGSREASWRLAGTYAAGGRAFLALEIESAELGRPLRLAAGRWEIR